MKSIVKAIGFSSQKKSVQDTVISSYNSTGFTHPSERRKHTHTIHQDAKLQFSKEEKKIKTKTTHIPGEKHTMHTPISVLQITATHSYTHTGCVKPDGSKE